MDDIHVHVESVHRRYGRVTALDGVNLELGPGVTGLLGPNGAGKTTLLRVMATLLAPTSGTVRVGPWLTTAARDQPEIRRRLGYLPQELGLYPGFTVFEFVDYMAALKELRDPRERHRRVRAALAAVGLTDVAGRRIRTLSGGTRRRVGVAQAVVANPTLLLLDEPTTGLDPEQRARLRHLVAERGEHGTVLLSTHLSEDVAAVCNRVVVLHRGRVLLHGAPSELRAAADGQVWELPVGHAGPDGAVSAWRTESGRLRVVGPRPGPEATALAPTLEDGYLVLTAAAGAVS